MLKKVFEDILGYVIVPNLHVTFRRVTYILPIKYGFGTIFKSSQWRCSVRKCVLKNFAKFTGKHLCQSFIFNKAAGLRPATLLKRNSGAGVFR